VQVQCRLTTQEYASTKSSLKLWSFPVGAAVMAVLAPSFRGAAMIANFQASFGKRLTQQDMIRGVVDLTQALDGFIPGYNLCRASLGNAAALLIDTFSAHHTTMLTLAVCMDVVGCGCFIYIQNCPG
jgi:hypothetical protein